VLKIANCADTNNSYYKKVNTQIIPKILLFLFKNYQIIYESLKEILTYTLLY